MLDKSLSLAFVLFACAPSVPAEIPATSAASEAAQAAPALDVGHALREDRVAGADPKGWYAHPPGTVADKDAQLARDGIDAKRSPKP
jgi:hypothetical protein